MTDNQYGSVSIQDRIESVISEPVQEAPEISTEAEHIEQVEEPAAEVVADETQEVEAIEAEETEAEEVPEIAEDELNEVVEASGFQTVDELAEALDMSVDDFLGSIKGRVKVDGEESEISLAELQAGYQKDADYRQKTSALAEERKAFQAEREQQQAEIQNRLSQSQYLIDNLNNQLMGEFSAINWDDLRQNDPGEYAAKMSEFQGKQQIIAQQYQVVQQEAAVMQQEQQEKARAQYEAYAKQESELLSKAIPAWQNPKTAKAEKAEVNKFLLSRGFSEAEVSQAVDHRMIKLAYDAMQIHKKADKVDIAKNKVKTLPKLVKPGAKQDQQTIKAKAAIAQRKAIKRGDQNALQAYLLSKV